MPQASNVSNETSPSESTIIKALSSSTEEIIGGMALTPISLKEIIPDQQYTPLGDVSAMMNITNNSEEGMIVASFPKDFAKLIISRLIGVSPEDLNENECRDGIGEIVNMIVGKSKIELSHYADSTFRKSLPSIIFGSQHEVNITSRMKYVTLLFESDEHKFYIQCSLSTFK